MHFMAAEVCGLKRSCELVREHAQAGGVHDLGLDRELRDALAPDRLRRVTPALRAVSISFVEALVEADARSRSPSAR